MADHAHKCPKIGAHAAPAVLLDQLPISATLQFLTGCAFGEVLGMVIGTGSQRPSMPLGPVVA